MNKRPLYLVVFSSYDDREEAERRAEELEEETGYAFYVEEVVEES